MTREGAIGAGSGEGKPTAGDDGYVFLGVGVPGVGASAASGLAAGTLAATGRWLRWQRRQVLLPSLCPGGVGWLVR